MFEREETGIDDVRPLKDLDSDGSPDHRDHDESGGESGGNGGSCMGDGGVSGKNGVHDHDGSGRESGESVRNGGSEMGDGGRNCSQDCINGV